MKLLAALCSLACLLVSLVEVGAIYTGRTVSQEMGELPTKRAPGNWTDKSTPQMRCLIGNSGATARDATSDIEMHDFDALLDDCQVLLNASDSHNGYWDIKPGGSLEVTSYGGCSLSVNLDNVDVDLLHDDHSVP